MEVFTTKEVAKKLKVEVSTIYRLRAAGKLGYLKVGGSFRYTQENIDDYIWSTATPPNPSER